MLGTRTSSKYVVRRIRSKTGLILPRSSLFCATRAPGVCLLPGRKRGRGRGGGALLLRSCRRHTIVIPSLSPQGCVPSRRPRVDVGVLVGWGGKSRGEDHPVSFLPHHLVGRAFLTSRREDEGEGKVVSMADVS